MRTPVDCPDLVMPNAGTVTQTVLVDSTHADAEDVILMCVSIDGAHTYTIQINEKRDGSGAWYTWNDGTNNILPPIIAGNATSYPFLNHTFRILANGAVAGPLTWRMKKVIGLPGFMDMDG